MEFSQFKVNALMEITARPDLVFVRGQGSWLEDHAGKRYLDFVQGWAVNTLGHCAPEMKRALAEQADKLMNPSPAFYNLPSIELAQRLTSASCFDRVFFANSGAEANEGAIKLARKWGRVNRNGAYKIITMNHGFHGRTLATMSASGKPGWDTMFAPQVEGFPKAEINDLDSVRALIDAQTVAVMLEPVQGEAGVIPATREFMQGLRKLADEHGILFIVDEVQTGMGRTGSLFAYQQFDVIPDIMTLAKGIGGGIPLAALLAREEVCVFAHGDQGGTYNGNPLCAAVGVAVFDTITAPGFMEAAQARTRQLSEGLLALSAKRGLRGERGMGLLRALVLDRDDAPAIVEAARMLAPEGLLLNAPRGNLLRFMPALNVTEADMARMLEQLDGVIAAVRK
ncbi:acetylornithine transaminase [Bordetella bronchiseptica]|uniref:Acetylornithine aminotransferase 2 n=4 Tax=Bordetella bronchiseptica TaxID=518 RepID=ARGD2_BORBR|nr:acetylornithine transaminase [Bordetella bronchiseptica]Q7WDN7.1 RecName: Full=Acetylornithine aminotransferase 2; Short=ACOAT 2 [Bordetella bronchiseptica RB50]KAK63629.1 transaminase, acetylornithine/succinylornithine family [Bordetella bronchiseptica 980-2]SHP83890.1 acetylornithine aminotransferase [Mycobacteroides abscessus subsp. abscessus]AMG86569.1 aspartate aminotransferase family protein [Bordetella bronchiseptica]AWP77410.1 aspartate aminotransferase family protein [Bordetella br